jgi:pimeloyl-ACP methyl ester carboxylesterase
VRNLVVVSIAFRRDGSHPEVVAQMKAMSPDAAEGLKQSPLYEIYSRSAPRVEDWPQLIAKISAGMKEDYDWSAEVAELQPRTLLVYADADSIRPAHVAEFFGLLGGGLRDANWDNSAQPTNQLAVLPGATHYDIVLSPLLVPAVTAFLDR